VQNGSSRDSETANTVREKRLKYALVHGWNFCHLSSGVCFDGLSRLDVFDALRTLWERAAEFGTVTRAAHFNFTLNRKSGSFLELFLNGPVLLMPGMTGMFYIETR